MSRNTTLGKACGSATCVVVGCCRAMEGSGSWPTFIGHDGVMLHILLRKKKTLLLILILILTLIRILLLLLQLLQELLLLLLCTDVLMCAPF